jgi:hypothetical protein
VGTSNGQPVEHGDEGAAAVRAVIERQLDAFRRDDAEEAFSYATPGIREMFGSAANFLTMVRASYAAVYRPRSVAFREVYVVHGEARQVVALVGPDGQPVNAVYHLQRQPDGAWRINGCVLVEPG